MNIEGTHTFAAPRDIVWPILLDPEALAHALPGCEELEKIGDNEYKGVIKIRIGPVQGKFDGVVTLSDLVEPESLQLTVNGKGAPGFVKGTGHLRLDSSNGSTILTYDGDAHVGGRIASVGQRLLDTSTKAIIRQCLEGMDQLMVPQPASEGGGEAARELPEVSTPSQAQFAAGVVKSMLEDFVPPEHRQDLISKAALAAGALLLLLIIDTWRMNRLARKLARHIVRANRES